MRSCWDSHARYLRFDLLDATVLVHALVLSRRADGAVLNVCLGFAGIGCLVHMVGGRLACTRRQAPSDLRGLLTGRLLRAAGTLGDRYLAKRRSP
jgi:hypothetical protein